MGEHAHGQEGQIRETAEPSVSGDVGAGPPVQYDRARAHTAAMAALRQATWEATQFLSDGQILQYVEGVLREVESDQP